ncbi:putative serine protease HtrA [Crateriforma conspicua]|uniref:Putative serine protease HtrA n=2 Tax=Crateriforma conspicua TaxID=2527996 RepID=A0A5C5YDQ8_9PLAN|nr:putative serine protease HtrA [Crateriforma conspicua]
MPMMKLGDEASLRTAVSNGQSHRRVIAWATPIATAALMWMGSVTATAQQTRYVSPQTGHPITMARPSLESPVPPVGPQALRGAGDDHFAERGGEVPSARQIDQQRERLFNELAEEFNAFDRLGNLVRRVAQLVKPSVIHIEAHKTENKGGQIESYDEAGAGVLISAGGETWVLTNRHVIAGASPQQILLRADNGREMSPLKVLADKNTDIAVMQIAASDLPAAKLGNSDDCQIGDFVIAIGSPFGLNHSVTFGIMSAMGRRDLSLGEQKIDLQDFFQTDAAINPGNSGGPLLNLRGEVVAINTAIASSSGGSEGIGFAIPINMAVQVADQLIRFGELRRGYLGVVLDPEFTSADMLSAGYQYDSGARVKNVRPGSPAATANLQRGDIIVEFNGRQVESDDHLVACVGLTPAGDSVPMIIYRNGKRYRTSVVLTDLQ